MSSPYGRQRDNPFADSTLYDVNTTYVPPDLNETVDVVVPAIPVQTAATGATASTQPAAAVPFPAPAAPAGGAATGLQFTESNLQNSVPVTGNIGRPATAPTAAGAAAAAGNSRPGTAPAANHSLPGDPDDPNQYAFYNVRRYRPYFNVDTKDVLWRVGSSFIGPLKPDFMAVTMTSPDLYGPFWVATTLIFVIAVAGNYADFIAFKSEQKAATDPDSSVSKQWYTNYEKMSYSALMFYGYVFVLGLVLYFALRWFK
eukprot:GHUV01014866.1.p1 GENE.GHUV01014866.1~~GHUV01014866.1.p1  ORF type:complete len:289 (+),score=77.15 GHUV01014866.1:98-868(+)